jgi:endonuclease/exonuclease/phosphatase family metal-dependent hydrolase
MSITYRLLKIRYFIVAYFAIATVPLYSQEKEAEQFRLMFYNAENFFDIIDDSLANDEDFLPAGLMRWNKTRFIRKVNAVYKTIIAAGEWEPPALISLCEVENRHVIEDLVYNTALANYKYRIVHEDSPDPRGIDVCLIYRSDRVRVLSYKYWIPEMSNDEVFSSRSVLHSLLYVNKDTLHLIINHWPSRRGGVLSAEDLRRQIAEMVISKLDSINRAEKGKARIILMGDFNCTPDDPLVKIITKQSSNGLSMINLSTSLVGQGIGTYRYQGRWEVIDQVIVSERLLDTKAGIFTSPQFAKVFDADFLLIKDPTYPGVMPFSTYRGFKYQGGFSDHLPVLIDLKTR